MKMSRRALEVIPSPFNRIYVMGFCSRWQHTGHSEPGEAPRPGRPVSFLCSQASPEKQNPEGHVWESRVGGHWFVRMLFCKPRFCNVGQEGSSRRSSDNCVELNGSLEIELLHHWKEPWFFCCLSLKALSLLDGAYLCYGVTGHQTLSFHWAPRRSRDPSIAVWSIVQAVYKHCLWGKPRKEHLG